MKRKEKFLKKLISGFFSIFFFVNMGDPTKKKNIMEDPAFTPLIEGQLSFLAIIKDEKDTPEIRVRDFSFYGSTKIGGILKEDEDSSNDIDLKNISEINIKEPHFSSKKYPKEDLCKIEIKTKTGVILNDLLAPRKVVVCGIRETSGIESSWFLSQLVHIKIQLASPSKKFSEFQKRKDAINEKLKKNNTNLQIENKNLSLIKKEESKTKKVYKFFISLLDSVIDFTKKIILKITTILGF